MSVIDDILGLSSAERASTLFKEPARRSLGDLEFQRAGISSIRKRALEKTLVRLDRHASSFERSLDEGRYGLSSSQYFAQQNQFETVRAAQLRVRSLISQAENLEDAERERLRVRKETFSPLRPAKRSIQSQMAAIAGIIERQRRTNAAMSRGAFARAQASAAARRRYDEATWYYKGADEVGSKPYSSRLFGSVDRGVDIYGYPCAERSVQRQVMFAKGLAGRGYSSPKRHRQIGC